jgi:hypothetical protein
VQARFDGGLAGLVAGVDFPALELLVRFLIEALNGAAIDLEQAAVRVLGAVVHRRSLVSIDAVAMAGQVLLAFAGADRALLGFSRCFARVSSAGVVRCRDEMLELTDALLQNALAVASAATQDDEALAIASAFCRCFSARCGNKRFPMRSPFWLR